MKKEEKITAKQVRNAQLLLFKYFMQNMERTNSEGKPPVTVLDSEITIPENGKETKFRILSFITFYGRGELLRELGKSKGEPK